MFLYAWLNLSGYDLPMDEIKRFRQLHSKTPGHPEFFETPGVECTTGPLGQGVGNAVGVAMAAKMAAMGFPFFYYENVDGGHSAAANLAERTRRNALEFTYLTQKLMD